jgi:murein DD-endopeptidase MepM/ murein hydrolase activator NlpD
MKRTSLLVLILPAIAALLSGCRAGGVSEPARMRAGDILLPIESTVIEDRVPRNATLDGLLRAQQIGADVAHMVITAARTAFDPRALRAGQPYKLVLTLGGLFRAFEYSIDDDRFLRVFASEGGESGDLKAEVLLHPKRRMRAAMAGFINASHSSLVAAVDQAGEHVTLALRLAEIFSGQIDFNADLQPADRIEALFEKDFREDQFSNYGPVLAATIVNDGRRLRAFRFVDADGLARYFDENGRSVRRLFLRSPLPFSPRVTSRFSSSRLHPVYGFARAHLGVDYAASVGTPVLAVADGVVVSAGFSGSSGRLVRLRHTNGYHTFYLHLSSIGRRIRPGARVSQGDIIGQVGASGVVTGPHLDYRLSKHGVFVDPLVEQRKLPPGDPIPPESMEAFEEARDEALRQLAARLDAPDALAASTEAPSDASLDGP